MAKFGFFLGHFLLCVLLLLFCSSATVVTVDVLQAKDLIRSGHRYLDVRTTEEFEKGHVDVEKPLNIPYMFNTPQGRVKNPQFLEQVSSACSKDDHLVVGCQSGVRSLYAATDLLNAEYKHVSNMGGGYAAWVENGLAVKKPELSLENEVAVKKPELSCDEAILQPFSKSAESDAAV